MRASDAQFCASCGEELPEGYHEFVDDLVLDLYRSRFKCPSCGYAGVLFRLDPADYLPPAMMGRP